MIKTNKCSNLIFLLTWVTTPSNIFLGRFNLSHKLMIRYIYLAELWTIKSKKTTVPFELIKISKIKNNVIIHNSKYETKVGLIQSSQTFFWDLKWLWIFPVILVNKLNLHAKFPNFYQKLNILINPILELIKNKKKIASLHAIKVLVKHISISTYALLMGLIAIPNSTKVD